jgi:hypothetical protein
MIEIRSLATGAYLDLSPSPRVTFTIENPMFVDDHMPVSVSTGIEFPLTPTNQNEFGFVDAMMLAPRVTTVPAVFILAGIEIFRGVLKFDEFADDTLKYTFVQTAITDQLGLTGKIHEIETELYEGINYIDLVDNARNEQYPDFGLPMMIRKPNVAKIEFDTPSAAKDCTINDKYANFIYSSDRSFRGGYYFPYFVPAVKISYLLEKILARSSFPSSIVPYLQRMAIIGTYQPSAWVESQQELPAFARVGLPLTSVSTNPNNYPLWRCGAIRVNETLPDMTCVDFVTELLKMFCCSIFSERGIVPNNDIINDTSFVDWSDKISKIYSIQSGEAGAYSFSYANTNGEFAPKMKDPLDDDLLSPSIVDCSSYSEMHQVFFNSEDYIAVRISTSKNIYSGKKIEAKMYYGSFEDTVPNEYVPIVTMDIPFQAGLNGVAISNNGSSSYDNSLSFQCVQCIPAEVNRSAMVQVTGQPSYLNNPIRGITPIIDFPTVGGERPSTVYIGLLYGHNMLDQGDYFLPQTLFTDNGFNLESQQLSIAIGGPDGLYEKFHKGYAEWRSKRHDTVKADVLLFPSDIANLALWQRRLIGGRLFFIRSMELSILADADIAIASTEFIDATV